jgi:putative heme-binding domain-containing protein
MKAFSIGALLLGTFAAQEDPAVGVLLDVTRPMEGREAAVKALAATRAGADALFKLAEAGRLPQELRATAVFALAQSPDASVREDAERKLPRPRSKDGKALPPIDDLVARRGDPVSGAAVFRRAEGPRCIACHQILEEGRQVGPPLTTIGTKLGREQLYESILTPSAGILMGYENWAVQTKDGDVKTGIKVEDTDDHVTLKDADGEYIDIPADKIAAKKMLALSMMPEELAQAMTLAELVDLVEYLSTLRAQ